MKRDKNYTIHSIHIANLLKIENHAANCGFGDGNTKNIKTTTSGKVYISGQKIGYSILENIKDINEEEKKTNGSISNTYVSNSDGTTSDITNDLGADIRGCLDTDVKSSLGVRVAPLKSAFAVSSEVSKTNYDILTNRNTRDNGDNKIANVEFSECDYINQHNRLELIKLGSTNIDKYLNNKHVQVERVEHITIEEKLRRTILVLKSVRKGLRASNDTRNDVNSEPVASLVVLKDVEGGTNTVNFFSMSEDAQRKIIRNFNNDGIKYFVHGCLDSTLDTNDDTHGVYESAIEYLNSNMMRIAYNHSGKYNGTPHSALSSIVL